MPRVAAIRARILSSEIPYFFYESRKMCRDKKWRRFSVRGKVIEFNENRDPIRAISTCTEITKSKEEEVVLEKKNIL